MRKSGENKVVANITIDKEIRKKLDEAAEKTGLTISWLINWAVKKQMPEIEKLDI